MRERMGFGKRGSLDPVEVESAHLSLAYLQ